VHEGDDEPAAARHQQMRGIWHRIADTDHLAQLRALVEDWNTTRIGPKAYLTVADGGVVRLHEGMPMSPSSSMK